MDTWKFGPNPCTNIFMNIFIYVVIIQYLVIGIQIFGPNTIICIQNTFWIQFLVIYENQIILSINILT